MMRKTVASIPVLIVVAFGALWWRPETRNLAWRVSDENQPIELLTFLALFAGGLLGLDFARRLHASKAESRVWLFYAAFALGMLLVALEEISWGQWFFEFDTPESVRWRNRQGEMNLHNIGLMYGKSSALRLAFAIGGAVGYWLRRSPPFRRIDPPRAILPWLAVIGLAAGIEAALDVGAVTWSADAAILFQHVMPEVTELLVGTAAFLYIWINRRRYAPAGQTVASGLADSPPIE